MVNIREITEKYNKMVQENKFKFSTIQANEKVVKQYFDRYPQNKELDEDSLITRMALFFHYIAYD
jgi:hypothetical protein